MGLKFGGLIGEDEKCASRGVMGDNERVMSRDAFSMVGGGSGTLGGGDKWLLMYSLIDEDDGMDEVEVP